MAKRAANKMGSLTQRSDGRWEGKVTYTKRDGSVGRKSVTGKTQADVKAKLKLMLTAEERHETVVPTTQTVEVYMREWLEVSVCPNVRPSTYASYKQLCNLYIVPALGPKQLGKLTTLDIQRFVTQLSGHKVKRTGAPMSKRTTRYAYSILKAALHQAVDWNLLAHNPAAKVKAPSKSRPEAKYLNPEQARHFLASVRGDKHECLYMLAITAGLRQGELLGLTYDCIDLDRRVLTVKQALQRVERERSTSEGEDKGPATEFALVPPKSKSSRRTIPLTRAAVEMIRSHRTRQNEVRLQSGGAWEDRNLVFATQPSLYGVRKGGMPIDGGNLSRDFHRALERAGLPRIRFHDLRHTCASLLLAQDVDLKVVQTLLGHSDFYITANTYQHVMERLERTAADRMDDLLTGTDYR